MENPFRDPGDDREKDLLLIESALRGEKESLSSLLRKHQDFIYNVALKFINHVDDAEDVTQEILIKILTHLAKYDPSKAQFRTWLYRIVFNHIMNLKKQRYEVMVSNFDDFFSAIESSMVSPLSFEEEKEMALQIEESKVACMAGMLMCLDREQRLTYIVGEVFEIEHRLASEIFEITPENFRKKLSRAKKDLHQWMHDRCGLINRDNPCRCPSKTRGFIENGWVESVAMKWNSDFTKKIFEVSGRSVDRALSTVDELYARLYREHPFKIPKKSADIVSEIVNDQAIRKFFHFD